jgi:hypothetical protein
LFEAVEEQVESELVGAVVVAGLEDVLNGELGEVEVLVGRLMALLLGLAGVARRSAG